MSEREDDLERRVKALEAAVEDMKKALYGRPGVPMLFGNPSMPIPPPVSVQGCICPAGVEAVCKAPFCPRRPLVAT